MLQVGQTYNLFEMEISSDSFLNKQKGVKLQNRPKTAANVAQMQNRPSSATTNGHKSQKNTTYQDWQVREENVRKNNHKSGKDKVDSLNTSKKMGASSKNATQKSKTNRNGLGRKSKSRSGSHQRNLSNDTSEAIRKRVQLQFNNYIETKQVNEEELSLLEDSQATLPRPAKQQILQEQLNKRKHDEAERRRLEQIELKKKEDALKVLELRFKSQTRAFQKQMEAEKRSQERKEKATRKREDDNSNFTKDRSAYDSSTSGYKIGKQVRDLKSWIQDAIKNEHMASLNLESLNTDQSAQNLEIPGAAFGAKPPKVKSVVQTKTSADKMKKQNPHTSVISNPILDEFANTKTGKAKMLKHQLPGNSQLTVSEQSKLGARKDRYGVFANSQGGNEFDKVVSAQKSKMLQISGEEKKPVNDWVPSKNEAKQVKQVLDQAIKSLGSRSNLKVADESEHSSLTPSEVESETEQEGRQTPGSEDSSDKIPVKQSPRQRVLRTMLNEKVDDVNAKRFDEYVLPGITNTQAHFAKQELLRREKEAIAVGVIQKFYRGYVGRKSFKIHQQREKQRVEFEYERLNQELKTDTQYNLKTYLAEKKRLRQKIGLADSADEIAEVIGETSSSTSQIKTRQSQAISTQLQNFFRSDAKKETAVFRDPLSLISIFAKRNGVIPSYEKAKNLKHEKSGSREKKRQGQKKATGKTVASTDSVIEEVYSNDFSDSVPKEQSIIEEEMPKNVSSSTGSAKLKNVRKPSRSGQVSNSQRKQHRDAEESIVDEVIDEESFQNSKRSDSIKEESIANEVESKNSKLESDSIAEDSIIRDEYTKDNFAQKKASQGVEARNRVKFGMLSQVQAQTQADKQKSADQLKLAEEQHIKTLERSRMIGDLMSEMAEYEKAAMSEVMVNRLEKILVSSLAQKDQLIMAQRMAELEAEKRHKEEINKIREEQIKLMSQLMLLGTASGQSHSAEISAKQREELLASIQKIVEKPIQIRNETVHVNYSVANGLDDQVHVSEKFGASVSATRKSYLEEYDESRRLQQKGNVINHSSAKYQEMIEEDISLRLGRNFGESSIGKKHRKSLQDSIEDMVGDVTSVIEESIKDEVGDSMGKISNSRDSRNQKKVHHDDADLNQKATAKDSGQDKLALFLNEVEKAIDSERSDREERLAQDLKKRKISPRTYDRGIKEIEKWVVKEKMELKQRRRKLQENQNDIHKYITKFKKDKSSVPYLAKLSSPRPDSTNRSYHEDSENSDLVQNALRQAYLIEKDLSGMSPDQKHTMKKREAAIKLIEQKEKAIKKALDEKMMKYQGGIAEELLQRALELDVEAEVERRFNAAKQNIEESRNLESARSFQSNEKTSRTKKSVQFHKSVNTASTKPTTVSTERLKPNAQPFDDESISESIKLADSYSQSLRSQSAIEISKSRSNQKLQPAKPHDKFSPQKAQNVAEDSENSIIESDYSQEFTEQSITSKELSQSKITKSQQKLQAKAKDLEESVAYSENFEEDSLAKNGTFKEEESVNKDKQLRMEAVKEETGDDSAQENSKDVTQSIGSRSGKASREGKDRVESSIGSLPSEDQSVKDSVRSVDWKIELPLESVHSSSQDREVSDKEQPKETSLIREERVEESELEEEIESSSDLNTRDDMNMGDLESCPDGVGASASLSQNDQELQTKADRITEELFELMLNDYKNNDEFVISKEQEQPDEEEWKNKFPWTLDKKPEPKPSPKPSGVKVGAQPRPPKTANQIKDEEFRKKNEQSMNALREREEKVQDFLDFLCARVDLKEMMEALNKPIVRDPLKVLSQIVNCYDEDDSLDKINDDTLTQAQQQILQQGFFNRMDREYSIMQRMKVNRAAVEDSDQLTVSQEEMENINNVHHYALFESINEALDFYRPYQSKGEPMPWSKSTRVVKQVESEEQAKAILQKARDQVIKWMKMRAGTNLAPLPTVPAQTQDENGEEIIPPPLEEGEEERRNMHRQEKLAELMTDDIMENDQLWVDYEIQDTQGRFDIADMILHHLAGEIAEFLAAKANNI